MRSGPALRRKVTEPTGRRGRRPRVPAVSTALAWAAVLSFLTPPSGNAQARSAADSLRRIQSVVPRSGPPGTPVTVHTKNLSLQARVYVAVGAVHDGFEVLAVASQDELGEVTATVRIPETASWDRPVVLIILDGIFSPIGMSEPFHVTSEEGMVRREGRITDEGAPCLTLRDDQDHRYALGGALGQTRPDDRVVVEGRYTPTSSCTGGSGIEVVAVSSPPPHARSRP